LAGAALAGAAFLAGAAALVSAFFGVFGGFFFGGIAMLIKN